MFWIAVGVFALVPPIVASVRNLQERAVVVASFQALHLQERRTAVAFHLAPLDIVLLAVIAVPLLAWLLAAVASRRKAPDTAPALSVPPPPRIRVNGRELTPAQLYERNWRGMLDRFWVVWENCEFCGRKKFDELTEAGLGRHNNWKLVMDRLERLGLIVVMPRQAAEVRLRGKWARAVIRNAPLLPLPRQKPPRFRPGWWVRLTPK